ncbi:hypothetical protein [Brevundimonas sp.]|uniref:hypothetical protein n=1 Tax=Brevundimonas sp. TaxID=1871086 RepID=UPI002D755912|nr:hypothetical protein [Brevundimonas sp.]HYD28910.1 hypothetical protein [Brevundimonas sp.]
MHCAACGYGPEYHDQVGDCPLCACGKLPSEHGPATTPPSPLRLFTATGPATWPPSPVVWFADHGSAVSGRPVRTDLVCPGRPRTESGALPTLRRGSYREPAPAEPFRPVPRLPLQPAVEPDPLTVLRAAEAGLPAAAAHPEPAVAAFPLAVRVALAAEAVVPQVPARYTVSLDEIAPAATRLGSKAAAAGWVVDPWYWVAADGTETSALVMHRDDLRAFAAWARRPGATWKSDAALGWRNGDRPHKLGVTKLASLIAEMA